MQMQKEFVCKDEDGTVMRSSHDEELVKAVRYHTRRYHKQRISKQEAMSQLKNISG